MKYEKPKSKLERVLYAIAFEFFGIVISAPLMSWLFNHSVFSMGSVAIVIAMIALLWNVVYNWIYDRLRWHFGWEKTPVTRIYHAVAFELGLALVSVPLILYGLDTDIIESIGVEIAFMVFYLIFTYCFNWIYDILRANWWAKVS
ncbi:PACE efflux transporter [Basilea psittacipulmonis]|uniref:Chlorhexidine efflux transporter domain-containing protein n=1 Tax=Basilea psittacipulmonis DSM 24701 TaxID=1072685 RepID=A0A077DAQ0_9BURK|nr:PACE efflux transporter [Basilea psittacipulmonis]AIL31975.1 hypothetical protein IX83_00345 [Basilea psittacipulmonis DSM 24701]